MLKLSFEVQTHSIAEPITTTDGKLLGVEMLTRLEAGGLLTKGAFNMQYFMDGLLEESKRLLLMDQIQQIKGKAEFFIKRGLVCSINVDFHMAVIILKDSAVSTLLDELPFIRLEISEQFPNLSDGLKNPLLRALGKRYVLWLDDLGSGHANMEAVQSGIFECIKVDKQFYWKNSKLLIWPNIIRTISNYCESIIIEGVETTEQRSTMVEGIAGIQGYIYKSVPFAKIERLKLLH